MLETREGSGPECRSVTSVFYKFICVLQILPLWWDVLLNPFHFWRFFYSRSDGEHGHWKVRQDFHLCCNEIFTSLRTPKSALAFNRLGPILASTSKYQSCPYKTFITAMVGCEECFKPLFLLPRATKMKGLNVFSWSLLMGREGWERKR